MGGGGGGIKPRRICFDSDHTALKTRKCYFLSSLEPFYVFSTSLAVLTFVLQSTGARLILFYVAQKEMARMRCVFHKKKKYVVDVVLLQWVNAFFT